MDLFEDKSRLVKICAPMVRYSRLPFRLLVQEYGCDLAFSPMIIADSFVKSAECRKAEFSTNSNDRPLIVQFAASNPTDFADATELVYTQCNGVDLNAGCPQRWANEEGLGSCLLNRPEHLADILRQARARIPDPAFSISLKIRVFNDLDRTVDLCRRAEKAGISFLTVHGRTAKERTEPVRLSAIATVASAVQIPVIANGDIRSLAVAQSVWEETGVRGVMSARAILENPGLYAGHQVTPPCAIRRWLVINEGLGSHFTLFHRHLIHMTTEILSKAERRVFNVLRTKEEVVEWLNEKFDLGYVQGNDAGPRNEEEL